MFNFVGLIAFFVVGGSFLGLCLWLIAGRKKKLLGLLLGTIFSLGSAFFVYELSSVSPSATILFTETFGEPPDATITNLKAIRTGGAGDYRAFIQFHAPTETVRRLVPGGLSHPSYVRSGMGWGSEKLPTWFRTPAGKVEEGSLPNRTYTGHFGIPFSSDGPPQIRYTPQENLVQVFWGFFE